MVPRQRAEVSAIASGSASIDPRTFLDELRSLGIVEYAGVPCSYFAGLYGAFETIPGIRYVPAAHEGLAMSYAAGSWLGGIHCAVLVQNSGFGNLINPLTSLVMPYAIPVVVIMSLRGWPSATAEEPQHKVMGETTLAMLDTLGISYHVLTAEDGSLSRAMHLVKESLARRAPIFILVPRAVLSASADEAVLTDDGLDRDEVVRVLSETGDALFLSTTGYISRSLFAAGDRPSNFYMQGSMGHLLGVAAGVAARTKRRVIALDGDGSMLMHMGAMSFIATPAPSNLVHVVLDNQGYESTGAQLLPMDVTDLTVIALAFGYARARTVGDRADLEKLRTWVLEPGPSFIHVRLRRRSSTPGGRASGKLLADEVADRFRAEAER